VLEGGEGAGVDLFYCYFCHRVLGRIGGHLMVEVRWGRWGNTQGPVTNKPPIRYLIGSVSDGFVPDWFGTVPDWFDTRLVHYQMGSESEGIIYVKKLKVLYLMGTVILIHTAKSVLSSFFDTAESYSNLNILENLKSHLKTL
jgi:hypothetical protein